MTDAEIIDRLSAFDGSGSAARSRDEARAMGLKRFFTGRPCIHGHLVDRMVANGSCDQCNKDALRVWKEKNKEKHLAAEREHKKKNRAHCREIYREWSERNREKKQEYRRQNKDFLNAGVRDWHRRNPGKTGLYNATRRGRLREAEGKFTVEDSADIRRRQRDRCAYCRCRLNGGGHLDHITAISKGGTNWPSNLQWVCRSCNSSKSDRDPTDFAQTRGLLL